MCRREVGVWGREGAVVVVQQYKCRSTSRPLDYKILQASG